MLNNDLSAPWIIMTFGGHIGWFVKLIESLMWLQSRNIHKTLCEICVMMTSSISSQLDFENTQILAQFKRFPYLFIRVTASQLTEYTLLTNTWWRHQMETFSSLLALCAGNSPVTGEFPSQRPVMRSFDVVFGLGLNKRLINNRQTGIWDAIVIIMTSL